MPGLISGSTLRRGGSGQFIDLKGAQPQLPPTPSTSTGFTLITDEKLVTTYASSLGNIQFSSGQMYSNLSNQNINLIGTGTSRIVVSGGTATTSTNTGALTVEGGVGISQDLFVGGNTTLQKLTLNEFTATTATITILRVVGTDTAISTTTGVLIVSGGVGIAKDLYVGGQSVLQQVTATILTATIATFVQASVTNGNDSNNTATGALTVTGGVGIGRNLNIGTTVNIGSTATLLGDLTVAGTTNLNGAVNMLGSSLVEISPNAANVSIKPALGGSIQIQPSSPGSIDAMSIGLSIPKDAKFLNAFANNFIGLATTSTNLAGGELGSIPYQTNTGTTAFIKIGPANSVLVSDGTTATFTNAANLEVTTSTYANNAFINTATQTTYHVILSTGTNSYAPLVEDSVFYYESTSSTMTVPHIHSQDGIALENNLLYTPRTSLSIGTPPAGARLGDFWIDPSLGATFQYIDDNGTKTWIQFTGI